MNRYDAIVAIVRLIPSDKRARAATLAIILTAFPFVTLLMVIGTIITAT